MSGLIYPPRKACGRLFPSDGKAYPCELDPSHVLRGEHHRNGCLTWCLTKGEAAGRWRDMSREIAAYDPVGARYASQTAQSQEFWEAMQGKVSVIRPATADDLLQDWIAKHPWGTVEAYADNLERGVDPWAGIDDTL